MLGLDHFCDVADPESLANRMRSRRFAMFDALVSHLPRPVSILDVGGTSLFWRMRGWADRSDISITLVNLAADPSTFSNIHSVVGDATDLSEFDNASFDIAFSNSVIEHLFSLDKQRAMAMEMQRVAKAHWAQTPNFWFPIEPHFHVPGWQWMPRSMRVRLLMKRRCGWRGPCPDREGAEALVDEVRLLTRTELSALFPNSTIRAERLGGLVKSWIVYGGFPRSPERGS